MENKAGKILKKLRKGKYTQAVVAKWIGKDKSTYGRKESGEIELFADEFLTVLYELGGSIEDLHGAEKLNKYTALLEKYIALKEESEEHKAEIEKLKKQAKQLTTTKTGTCCVSLADMHKYKRHDDPDDFDPSGLREHVHELFRK